MVSKLQMNLLVAIVAMASSVSASAGVIEFFGNGACQILGQGNQFQIKDNSETGCIRLVGDTQSAEYMMGGNCLVGLYSSDNCDPNTVIGSINPGPDGATGCYVSPGANSANPTIVNSWYGSCP